MFDKNELYILLRSLEASKNTIKVSCIFCEIVDYYEHYAKTKYCVANCNVCKDIDDIENIIFKIKEALK